MKSDSFTQNDFNNTLRGTNDDTNAYDTLESNAQLFLEKLKQKIDSVKHKQERIKIMIEQDYDPAADLSQNKAAYLNPEGSPNSNHNLLRMLDTSGRDDIKFLTAKYTLLSAAAEKLGLTKAERKQYVGEEDRLFITTKVQLEELKQSLATLGDQIAVREGNIEGLKKSLREVDTKLETVSNALAKSMAVKGPSGQSAGKTKR